MDPWRRLETCLSELVDYRRIHGTTMFLTNGAKTRNWFLLGQRTKEGVQVAPCRKDIAHDRLRIQALVDIGFFSGRLATAAPQD
jgi:hypothetical protein